jgi:hypothetical protein
MLTALFAACLLVQQQPRPQAKPRQQQTDAVTVQGRDFSIPHVPATEKQAKKEYKAVLKKIKSTIDILEDDLALLYSKYPGDELFRDFAIPKEKVALPEVAFFASVIRDEKLASYFDEIVKQWNEWQLTTVQAGVGKMTSSKESPQNDAPEAVPRLDRLPGVNYEKQKFQVEGVHVDVLPTLREVLAEWDIELKTMKQTDAEGKIVPNFWIVLYQLDLPTVASLQSVMGLSKSDAKKIRNQKALATSVIFSTAKAKTPLTEKGDEELKQEREELEVEIMGPSIETEAKKLSFQMTQNWANVEIAKAVSGLYAPDFAKTWESFQNYLNGRIGEFLEMEASPLIYEDGDIKCLYDIASIKFMEQLRLSLWLCQNVWHRMAATIADSPKPLAKLAPNIVRATNAEKPSSYIVLNEMGKKDLDKVAKAISRKEPRLFMVRLAQPIYAPNESETPQAEETAVKVTIAMNGSVSNAEYVSGPEHLRELSLQAAKLLRFYPLRESGFNEPQSTNISFNF